MLLRCSRFNFVHLGLDHLAFIRLSSRDLDVQNDPELVRPATGALLQAAHGRHSLSDRVCRGSSPRHRTLHGPPPASPSSTSYRSMPEPLSRSMTMGMCLRA